MSNTTNNDRLIVIGDIHGCYNSLVELLQKIKYTSHTDTLLFLGDYIDRGPYSSVVVRTIRRLQSQLGKEKVICLRGNHEQFAIEGDGQITSIWAYNGGMTTLQNYQDNGLDISDDIPWFRSLPFYHQTEDFIFCHAGLAHPKLADNSETDLIWDRDWLKYDATPREKLVIFGHTPMRKVPYVAQTGDICIDGGCVYGGVLCAAVIQNEQCDFVSVKRSLKDTEDYYEPQLK